MIARLLNRLVDLSRRLDEILDSGNAEALRGSLIYLAEQPREIAIAIAEELDLVLFPPGSEKRRTSSDP